MDAIEQAAREQALVDEAAKWAKRREEQREREWLVSEALMNKAQQMLLYPLQRTESQDGKAVFMPAKWTFGTAASFLETAAKLARLSAEMETERHVNLTPEQLREMRDEDFIALAQQHGVNVDDLAANLTRTRS